MWPAQGMQRKFDWRKANSLQPWQIVLAIGQADSADLQLGRVLTTAALPLQQGFGMGGYPHPYMPPYTQLWPI